MRIDEAKKLVQEKVADYLLKQPPKSAAEWISATKEDEPRQIQTTEATISSRSKWHQQKRLDPVDNLLAREMREQEYEWSNYEAEEYEAKVLVADAIFDLLLHDTIEAFQISFIKKNT